MLHAAPAMSTVAPKHAPLLSRALLLGRIALAAAIAAAVLGQLSTSLQFWTLRGDPDIPLHVINFFSFFAIQANLLAMVTLALLAVRALRRAPLGRAIHVLALCATAYLVATGIVYNTVLLGVELPLGATLGWSNVVLVLIAPLGMLIDWLLSARERAVRWPDLAIVTIYPLLWLTYTLVRGPLVSFQTGARDHWYPAPVLDPAGYENGYGSVMLLTLAIAATFAIAGAVLITVSRAASSARAHCVTAEPRGRGDRELEPEGLA